MIESHDYLNMIDYVIRNVEDNYELTIKEQWLCDKINSIFKTNFEKDKPKLLTGDKSVINYLDSHIPFWQLTRQYLKK